MAELLKIWTLDWVPGGKQGPSGFVRDLRLRWACEEAGLKYEIHTVPLTERPGPEHLSNQPFGQVPWLDDGAIQLFESGACLLHLARKSEKLLPRDVAGEAETIQWTIAALNSIEMVTVPWWFIGMSKPESNPLEGWVHQRLAHLGAVLEKREWLAARRFTVADLLMADVLRVPKVRAECDKIPALKSYVDKICARPAFQKAFADQVAHFEKGDQARAKANS